MKKLLNLLFLTIGLNAYTQVAINNDNSNPAPSAMLDVKSTDKGMLIPRMSSSQRTGIASPASGLLVFDNTTQSFWYFNGAEWDQLISGIHNSSQITDTDGDTKVMTEDNPDEDILRVKIAGIERIYIDSVHMDMLVPDSSTIIGHKAGFDNAILTDPGQDDQGKFNTFIGYYSGYNNNPDPFVSDPYDFNNIYEGGSGSNNTFLGNKSGFSNSQGRNNLFVGSMAGLNNTGQGDFVPGEGGSGSENTFLGFLSGNKNTRGHWNTFVGAYSGELNGTGVSNFNTQSSFNTYIGSYAGRFNQSGTRNTYVGSQSGGDIENNAGDKNVFIGSKAGFKNKGIENVFVGTDAGFSPQGQFNSGNGNTFIGTDAGFNNEGDNNVFAGNDAGNNNGSGDLNTIIGAGADVGSPSLINAIAIGSNARVDQSNCLTLGSISGINGATADVNVGIGTTSADTKLEVQGSNGVTSRLTSSNGSDVNFDFKRIGSDWRIRNTTGLLFFGQSNDELATVIDVLRLGGGSVTPAADNTIALGALSLRWTGVFAVNGTIQTSDEHLKKNIVQSYKGIETILKLKPVAFEWKDPEIDNEKTHLGFLAQDLQKVLPEVVVDYEWKEIPDSGHKEWVPAEILGVNYSEITPVLVKAIQEQQQIIEKLQQKIEELEITINKPTQ